MDIQPGQAPWLVSIIITSHNYGRFLREAIDSALNQTYPAVEVIVVDDGSTDNSREIIASYGDCVIPVLQENQGQAAAFNAGIAHSQGRVVIFLDADDVLLPQTAQQVIAAFQQNPELVKVQYPMRVIDACGIPTGAIKPAEHLPRPSGDLRRNILRIPFDTTWMSTSGNAFAMSVLEHIFPIPESHFGILADYYLALITPLFGPVLFLDTIGAAYRIHGSNNHQPGTSTISLPYIRQTIRYSYGTLPYIQKFADQLGLETRDTVNRENLSVSLLANRLISLKLDPTHHPIPEDTLLGLFQKGINASLKRFDVSWTLRFLFIGWFGAMVLAPQPVARWLAEKFSMPESRGRFNQFLGRLHGVHQ